MYRLKNLTVAKWVLGVFHSCSKVSDAILKPETFNESVVKTCLSILEFEAELSILSQFMQKTLEVTSFTTLFLDSNIVHKLEKLLLDLVLETFLCWR